MLRSGFRRPTLTAAATDGPENRGLAARFVLGKAFVSEGANYFLLLGITLFLVAFGLVMVLSSSSVESFANGNSAFADFLTQGGAAVLALPAMLAISIIPARWWPRLSVIVLVGAVAGQLLVFTGLGYEYGGNRNWLDLGFVNVQPSEFSKLALALWLGKFLADRRGSLSDWRRVLVPALIVSAIPIVLVLRGGDLGTAIILATIVLAALFFGGVPLRQLGLVLVIAAPLAIAFSLTSASRSERIQSWLSGCSQDYANACWQITHGTWALAAGGVFGVGLGNSKAKWSWLPEADNDFIFAVVGEELGLVGAVTVLILFVVLAVVFTRIVSQSAPGGMGRITVAAVGTWIVSQALVNIGVILGVFPVLGVPLPLISSGGTALIVSMLAIGVALSFARVPGSALLDHVPANPRVRPGRAARPVS
ncbi:FtsW/RodA/SpoVE family cell cycle protein [Amnibacterium flavum]|uniref:FtsW/RodA/SpoVE family cell cycle protein n=1 Tax=Amnibacterium flavum TaxID=2173173 RepID=UPI001F0BFFCF|nr:putative peptidoglycan glycosyltransferase FtsW [Amnibacterium flavum]